MLKQFLTLLILATLSLTAAAQVLSLKAGIAQDGAVAMNIPINTISGEISLGKGFSAQATVGLRNHEDNRPGYGFRSRHLGLQFRSYIFLKQNKFLNGFYIAASAMHNLFTANDGHEPVRTGNINLGVGPGFQQVFLRFLTLDAGMILTHPIEKGTQFPMKQYGAFGYLQLGISL